MKKLLIISILSLTFSQELKVDGNLNVTGAVINDSLVQVIDSLKVTNINQQDLISSLQALIVQLQAQITSLEAQMNLIGSELTDIADCNGVIGGDAVLDCAGICNGDAEIDVCGICGGNVEVLQDCLGVTDIDGNYYETVWIGEQHWMAENLKATHFRNGDDINPGNSHYYYYGEGGSGTPDLPLEYYNINVEIYIEDYGYLYNWHAVNDSRGLCPEDWHVATDEEYTVLTEYLGGTSSAGGKMKAVGEQYWFNNTATNESGFTAVGGGYRQSNSNYFAVKEYGYLWTSTLNSETGRAWYRILHNTNTNISRTDNDPLINGFSVRCIQD